jgi:hypothetical protein
MVLSMPRTDWDGRMAGKQKTLTIEFTSVPSIIGGVGGMRLRLQDLSLNAALLHRVVFIRHPQGSTPR